jgi:hypothetical protein
MDKILSSLLGFLAEEESGSKEEVGVSTSAKKRRGFSTSPTISESL